MSDDANKDAETALPAPTESDSRRYWRAAISHLSDPQKRDAAWEFYLRKMEARKSSDTISALVLLLEANGVFLEHLPERYQQQLIVPLNSQLEGLQRMLTTREEQDRAALANAEEIARSNLSTTNRAVAAAETIERALGEAATAIDAQAVSREIKQQIEETALKPFARQLEELTIRSRQIEQATGAADKAVQSWRRVHLGGIVLCGWGSAILVCAALFFGGWGRLKNSHEREMAHDREAFLATTAKNQEIVRLLGELRIRLRLRPVSDETGERRIDALTVCVEPEPTSSASVLASKEPGVTLLRTPHAADVLRKMRVWLDKPRP